MENNFKWTDKSVLAFNQVYAGNFESKLLAHTQCSYAKYVGKKAEEKLEQFKKDWTEPRDKYIVVLQFNTNRIAYGSSRGQWSVRKEFNDLRHCNNFINYIENKKGYTLDELFYESGYPFQEGDDYWTIEQVKLNGETPLRNCNEVVHSCWDEESEKMFDPNKIYFTTKKRAEEYMEWIDSDEVTIINLKQ